MKAQSAGAWRGDWQTTLLVCLLSLVPRLYAAIALSGEPVWDGHYYDFGARRIALGLGYSDDIVAGGATVWHPWCHYPVGYSGFLGGLYALFGTSRFVAPVANAAIGSITVMLTHRLGLHWLGKKRAVIASVLCALSLELVLYCPLLMTETLATCLPLLALWIALAPRNSSASSSASGCVIGLATLVQPQSIILAPLFGSVVAKGKVLSKKRLVCAAIATASALVVVAPWTMRNCGVLDGCAFVSTNGGWNLAIGSFPRATGRFETLRASDGCAVVSGQVQQDRCWGGMGVGWIRRDIRRWIGLIPAKLGYCFNHASFPVEYLAQADPLRWTDQVRTAFRGVLTGIHRVLLTVAAFGFVAPRIRKLRKLWFEVLLSVGILGLAGCAWFSDTPVFWPLAIGIAVTGLLFRKSAPYRGPVGISIAVVFATFVAIHILFFGEDRYHVRLIPLLCLLAAAVGRNASCEQNGQHCY